MKEENFQSIYVNSHSFDTREWKKEKRKEKRIVKYFWERDISQFPSSFL